MALLEIDDLHLAMTSFEGKSHILKGINLKIERGEIWGVVGETGSGKSLTGLSVSRLVPTPPGNYLNGSIKFEGQELLTANEATMQRLRGRHIGMVFQDPTTNLNPAFRIGTQLVDVALQAGKYDPSLLGVQAGAGGRARRIAARLRAIAVLDEVGIPEPAIRIDNYPHELSGGMRQRVLIATAMIGRPDLLIADEPTTALDVSVQAQILRLIHGLVIDHNIGVMLITHNLGVVAQICTHVAVMFRGRILEAGPVHSVLKSPQSGYTQALLQSIPTVHSKRGELRGLSGMNFENEVGV